MNILTQVCRRLPEVPKVFRRNYAQEKFSVVWKKPEKISCIKPEKSGDLGIDYTIDPTKPCKLYENIPELQNSDELVKKIFSLEYNPSSETAKIRLDKALSLVQKFEGDHSFECIIAKMTADINYLQEYMEVHPRNVKTKVALKEKIDKRKKYLKRLRNWDYKRFEWILEQLNLVYKPSAEGWYCPARKDSVRKLAAMHCEKVKTAKLEAYKAELKSLQKGFFEKKAKQLAFIREEELACGESPTVTEEEIESAKKMAQSL